MFRFAVASVLLAAVVLAQYPPVPGINAGIGRGFDVKKSRVCAPVVQFTYNYQQTFPNPYMNYSMQMYPDQTYITNMPGTADSMDIDIFTSYDDYEKTQSKWLSASVNFGISGVKVGVGYSAAKTQYNQLSHNNTRNLAQQNRMEMFYQLSVWPTTPPGPQFTAMVKQLPKEYDAQKYQTFIDAFGTHYVADTIFGSFLNYTVAFDKSLTDSHSQEWVSQQIKLSISYGLASLGVGGGKNSTTKNANQTFLSHSGNYNSTSGGNPTIFEQSGYNAWLATVPENPAMLRPNTTMKPLHEMIEDSTIAANLKKALVDYLNDPSPN